MNSGSHLIVDFPSSRREDRTFAVESTLTFSLSDVQTATQLPPSLPTKKTVHFLEVADMAHVDIPSSSEMHQRWYNAYDMIQFRRILAGDVRRMISIVSLCPGECLSKEILEACIGIEVFLSQDLTQRTREKRARHTMGVLNECGRQRRCEMKDSNMLSMVSKSSSKWSRDRAFKLAVGYWELFREMDE
ncbi:hypothetical protein ACHAXS_009504 [Conticribra weissflogii]